MGLAFRELGDLTMSQPQMLSKGQNVPLDHESTSLRMSVRWSGSEDAANVDLVALLVGQDGRVRSDADMIFYNQPATSDGAVVHAGKIMGDGRAADDVSIDIAALADDVMSLTVAASTDGTPFGEISDLEWCVLLENGDIAARYQVRDMTSEQALVLGELYRRGDGWRLRAVGQGWDGGLAGLATDYGVNISDGSDEPEQTSPDDNEFELTEIAEPLTGGPVEIEIEVVETVVELTVTESIQTTVRQTTQLDSADDETGINASPATTITAAPNDDRIRAKKASERVKVTHIKTAKVPVMQLADDPSWSPSRLFSVSGIGGADEQEKRATSALMWVMSAVRPLGRALTGRAMAPAGTVETFIEVPFSLGEQKVIPDGVIRIARGNRMWTALVEVKTGDGQLHRDQLDAYLRLAKRRKFDAVLTISNEVSTDPGIHPVWVPANLTTSVALVHLSWSEVMHEIKMLLAHRAFTDPLSMWILAELLKYLEHPRSGAMAFHDMGAAWVPVREAVVAGTLGAVDRKTEPVILAWHRLVRQLALGLTARLGVPVKQSLPRRLMSDPDLRNREAAQRLADTGTLTATFKVPDAAGPITVSADLRTSRIRTSVDVVAPQEGQLQRRVGWLARQLKNAPGTSLVEAHFDPRPETKCERLSDVRTNPGALIPGKEWEPSSFTVSQSQVMGTKRSGAKGSFVSTVTAALDQFYADVVEDLRPWTPPAPQLPPLNDGSTVAEAAEGEPAPK